jgi:hypothetical protein
MTRTRRAVLVREKGERGLGAIVMKLKGGCYSITIASRVFHSFTMPISIYPCTLVSSTCSNTPLGISHDIYLSAVIKHACICGSVFLSPSPPYGSRGGAGGTQYTRVARLVLHLAGWARGRLGMFPGIMICIDSMLQFHRRTKASRLAKGEEWSGVESGS